MELKTLDVTHLSPAERMDLAWALSVKAWTEKHGRAPESRIRRDIVVTLRKRGPSRSE